MLGWLRRRRETAERIDAQAEALMRDTLSGRMPKLGGESARRRGKSRRRTGAASR